MSNPQVVVGSFLGTGTAINVELGFVPNKITLINQTTGRTATWFSTMAAGSAAVSGAIVGTGLVSAYDGVAAGKGYGFTLGTDAINGSGNTIAYEATRTGPGGK